MWLFAGGGMGGACIAYFFFLVTFVNVIRFLRDELDVWLSKREREMKTSLCQNLCSIHVLHFLNNPGLVCERSV